MIFLMITLLACGAAQPAVNVDALPVPQMGHVLIAKSQGKMVLFGGFAGETIFGSVSRLSDAGWQLVDESTPFADRTWYTATVYGRDRTVLVFGGKTMSRQPFGETWTWRNGRWRQFEGAGPKARSHHTAVYDSERDVVVLVGGDGGDTLLSDIWEWDGDAWEQAKASGPAPRAAHMSAYDPLGKQVVVAGGVAPDNETRLQDSWGWDGERWRQLPDLPSPRALGAAASDDEGMLIFGGWREGFTPVSETLRLTGEGWSVVTGDGPPPTAAAALTFDEHRRLLVLSGGMDEAFQARDDIWTFASGRWSKGYLSQE